MLKVYHKEKLSGLLRQGRNRTKVLLGVYCLRSIVNGYVFI